jgi:hypothetical protein
VLAHGRHGWQQRKQARGSVEGLVAYRGVRFRGAHCTLCTMFDRSEFARRRDLAKVIATLNECLEYKRMRQRQGLLTDGTAGLRSLERKLELARQALRTLDTELRAVASPPDATPDEAQEPLEAVVARLRELRGPPEVWSAVRFLVDGMVAESGLPADSHPEWHDVPPELAAAVRDLLGHLIRVAFFERAPRLAIEGAEAAVQGWAGHSELGSWWLAELCTLFET